MPPAAPSTTPISTIHQADGSISNAVATTATNMPAAAIRLPRRAVFGLLNSRRPTMKQTPVMR